MCSLAELSQSCLAFFYEKKKKKVLLSETPWFGLRGLACVVWPAWFGLPPFLRVGYVRGKPYGGLVQCGMMLDPCC